MNPTDKTVLAVTIGVVAGLALAGTFAIVKARTMIKHLDTRIRQRNTLIKKMHANDNPTISDLIYYVMESDRINNIKI